MVTVIADRRKLDSKERQILMVCGSDLAATSVHQATKVVQVCSKCVGKLTTGMKQGKG